MSYLFVSEIFDIKESDFTLVNVLNYSNFAGYPKKFNVFINLENLELGWFQINNRYKLKKYIKGKVFHKTNAIYILKK